MQRPVILLTLVSQERFDLFVCGRIQLTRDGDRERLESTNRDTYVAERRQEPKSGFARGHLGGNHEHGRRIGNRVHRSGRGLARLCLDDRCGPGARSTWEHGRTMPAR